MHPIPQDLWSRSHQEVLGWQDHADGSTRYQGGRLAPPEDPDSVVDASGQAQDGAGHAGELADFGSAQSQTRTSEGSHY